MHVNDLISEMNKVGRKIWNVYSCETDEWVAAVGATDNNVKTATKYACGKYGKVYLVFREWKEK